MCFLFKIYERILHKVELWVLSSKKKTISRTLCCERFIAHFSTRSAKKTICKHNQHFVNQQMINFVFLQCSSMRVTKINFQL
jgi:hypothetical protein